MRLLVAWDHAGRGTSKKLMEFADQAMSEYDRDGWTLPELRD